jgi:hypothetical protein
VPLPFYTPTRTSKKKNQYKQTTKQERGHVVPKNTTTKSGGFLCDLYAQDRSPEEDLHPQGGVHPKLRSEDHTDTRNPSF